METRIVEMNEFVVKGFSVKGSFAEIPPLWDRLNEEIAKKGIIAEESFGVTLSMHGGKVDYIAGIKSALAEDFSDAEEVVISAGKFVVAKVQGGVPAIPQTFDALIQRGDLQFRKAYGMERYIHPVGSEGYEIEVWMPVE